MSTQAKEILRLALAGEGPMNRMKSLVQLANMEDSQLEIAGLERDQARRLRKWLDVLAGQSARAFPRYSTTLKQIANALGDFRITWRPFVDVEKRRMPFRADYELSDNMSIVAFIVGSSFNSDLYKRIGRCPECIRRREEGVKRGKPVALTDGPYFVRDGRGDTRKYCTARHTRTATTRAARERKKLQQESQDEGLHLRQILN